MTNERMVTINKHEASYEGLALKFEAGEDALEALSQSRGAPTNITPKKRPITSKEMNTIPGVRQASESAQFWLRLSKRTTGRPSYIAKQAFKEDSSLMQTLRDAAVPIIETHTTPSYTHKEQEYPSKEWVGPNGEIHYEGFSLMNKKLCGVLLKDYLKYKGQNWGKFNDLWFMIMDFESILFDALGPYPVYQAIVEQKWSNLSNLEIVREIEIEFGKTYTPETISNLYCNKIPEKIAKTAQDKFLDWWYTYQEKGTYKTCSSCGQTLLAHPRFFNKNSTSKDGFYSQCKACRASKRKLKKG